MFKLIKNNFGVGLVEVLLASGIGLVVTMGIFRVSTTALKTTRVTQTILAEESLSKVVRESLGNEADCKWNLSPTRLTGGTPLTGQSVPTLVKNGVVTNQAVTLIKTKSTTELGGFPEENPLLIIKKLELKQVHSADPDQREFTVYYEKKGLGRFSTRGNRACTSTNLSGCYKLTCKMSYKNPFLPDTNPESANNCKLLDCVASEDVLRGQTCPDGQYLQGFGEFEELTCAPLPTACPSGQALRGFNPDGTAGVCASVLSSSSSTCPPGQIPKGLKSDGSVNCGAICGSTQQWSEICKKCYNTAPSGKNWSHAECDFVCSSRRTCSASQRWDESTCACVNKCATGETHDSICENKEQEPKAKFCYAPCSVGTRWSSDTCSCVSKCPTGSEWLTTCNPARCKPTCPSGTTWDASTCRCNCPSSASTWDATCNRCRATCANGYTWSSSPSCRCKSRCKEDSTEAPWKWDSTCNRCKSTCPAGQFWSSSFCRCVSRCNTGGNWNATCNKCQYSCPLHQRWDASRCSCVDKCTGNWSARCNKCRTSCPVGKKWSWSKCSCISKCPNSQWSQRCKQCIPLLFVSGYNYFTWDNNQCDFTCSAPQDIKTACNRKPQKTLNRVVYSTGRWGSWGTTIATYSWDDNSCECKETIKNICRDLRDYPYRYPHLPDWHLAMFRRTGTTCLVCGGVCTNKQKLHCDRTFCRLTDADWRRIIRQANNYSRAQCRPGDWDEGLYQCVKKCSANQHWNGSRCVTCSSTQSWSSSCNQCYSCSSNYRWNDSVCRCYYQSGSSDEDRGR